MLISRAMLLLQKDCSTSSSKIRERQGSLMVIVTPPSRNSIETSQDHEMIGGMIHETIERKPCFYEGSFSKLGRS
jgi:hypothetical protein